MAEEPRNIIHLGDEIEGDTEGTSDFVFCRIGSSVPLKPSDSHFDLKNPPARPLAASERFGVLFLAHSGGFLVAKTKEVIKLAKEIKEIEDEGGDRQKSRSLCVEELSILDLQIRGVHILALSTDSSTLAVAVEREIHFFSVPSLLNKEQEPLFTSSLGDSGHAKDLLWRKNTEKSFIILSNHGSLYHGNLEGHLKDVLDNVDAVDWSVEGNFLAVARKNILSIFSFEFKEQRDMFLMSQSWSDVDSEYTLKVDSIKWVRSDSIVIGCIQVNQNGEEVGYMVQVITSKGSGVVEATSQSMVVSFSELFHGIVDDIVPFGGGPYLFMSYLDRWQLALAVNRKNVDDHVVLLAWSLNNNSGEAVALEFEQDKFIPRIELQENHDENLILGFDVDKISIYEKLELKIDAEEVKALSPYCILLCLTCEGKLIMYHVARVSEPSIPLLTDDISSVNEKYSAAAIFTSSRLKDYESVSSYAKQNQIISEVPVIDSGEELKGLGYLHSGRVEEQPKIPASKNDQGIASPILAVRAEKSLNLVQLPMESPLKQGFGSAFGTSMNSVSQMFKITSDGNDTSTASVVGCMLSDTTATKESSKVFLKNDDAIGGLFLQSSIQSSAVGSHSMGKINAPDGLGSKSSTSTGSTRGDAQESLAIQTSISSDLVSSAKSTGSKDYLVYPSPSDGQKPALMRPGHVESAPMIRSFPSLLKESFMPGKFISSRGQDMPGSYGSYRSPGLLDSEPKLSKHFYNVEDMTKELDSLLACIEQEGGFRDACTVAQKSSLSTLEEALENISDRFRMCKATIEEQVKEIQQLQDKWVQVAAKQIYMEGIVKQASNNQYWDVWNRQKLGPEFELKRQQLVKLNQSLTSQLVELERHFNALELNKFGESGGIRTGRRALLSNSESGRQSQFVHSLYNTLNSQLAAAEQLSECLSKQMGVLNINSSPAKRQSIAKELFGSIGLTYDFDSFQSPDRKKVDFAPDSTKKNSQSSSSTAAKEYSKRKTLSALKVMEPETSRRRKDSLDRSWAGFEPPKTTVKRMLQEEHFRVNAEKSFRPAKEECDLQIAEGFVASQKCHGKLSSSSLQSSVDKFQPHMSSANKDVQEKLFKQGSESQSSSIFQWAQDPSRVSQTVVSKSSAIQAVQTSKVQPSSSVAVSPSLFSHTQNKTLSSSGSAELLNNEVAKIGGKSDSSTVNTDSLSQTRFSALFEASTPSQEFSKVSSTVLPARITTVVARPSSGGLKHGADTPEGSYSMTGISQSSLSAHVKGSAFQVSTVASKSQSNEAVSSTAFSHTMSEPSPTVIPLQSSGSPSSSLASVSASPSESPATSSALSFGGTLSAATYIGNVNKTSLASVSSAVSFQPLHSSSSAFSLHSQDSKVSPAFSLPLDSVTSQATPSQHLQPSEVSSTSEQALSLRPASEVSAGLSSGSQSSLLTTTVSVFPPSHSSFASSNLSSTAPKENYEALDLSVVQEDEMEEEAPETSTMLNLGALGGFGLGSIPVPSASKPNPFGGSFVSATTSPTSSPFSLMSSPGELFRPASFTIPSAQPVQSSQPMNPSGFTGGFSGFGQPAQIGTGQQALGSVLGGFGQSRQLGVGVQGMGFASSAGFGAGRLSSAAVSGGGFVSGTGDGFSAVASSGGGFAGAARGGGFAAMASSTGGFGAFRGKQGASGFPAFGGSPTGAAGNPPAEFLMQMRK